MGSVRSGQPLPLRPAGSVPVGPAVTLIETAEGGVTFVWGMAAVCWSEADVAGRRLAAVSLVETKAARHNETARAFGVDPDTLRCWRHDWEVGGIEGLSPQKRGPKGPTKLLPEIARRIKGLRASRRSLRAIAAEVGVSTDTVRRAIAEAPSPESTERPGSDLEPLARPEPRDAERALARAGLLAGAQPVICEGASLPLVGALVILPALAVTGLLESARTVYAHARSAAFYGIESLLLTLVFSALVGEPRAEGLTRLDPPALGRLLGLDRAPEVGTMRRRMEKLAGLRHADQLLMALARHHVAAHPEAMGVLYVDGHVRAYHGGSDLPRAHLARARLAMAATTDCWLADRNGDAVLVWSSPPGQALTGELLDAVTAIRELLGEDARPTIAFDRGGWSPVLFAQLYAAGFHILTYRKGPLKPEPRSGFRSYEVADQWGHPSEYLLADRRVRIAYDKGRRYFACRQVTRLDERTGHQTQIVTTRADVETTEVAVCMFGRWREENLFRFMRPRGLDAMDSYAKTPDDLTRMVPNPAKAAMAKQLAGARAAVTSAKEKTLSDALDGKDAPTSVIDAAKDALASLQERSKAIPAKVPLGEIRPDAVRLDDERKRIHDAVRMATWNAESALARSLGPHYARAEDEAHSLLAETFCASADLEVVGDEVHVRLEPLSAPRRSRAIAAICNELTATETVYPGTKLRLVYSVKGF
jgi:prepilin-type processing-associated H-X9-DG protein